MNLKDAIALQIIGMIVIYCMIGVAGSFILWDFNNLWVGNWHEFARFAFVVLSMLWSYEVYDEFFKEETK